MRSSAARRRSRGGCGCLLALASLLAVVAVVGLVPDVRHRVTAHLPYWAVVRSRLSPGVAAPSLPPVVCRSGNVLANVQVPSKLTVIAPCVTGMGIVLAKLRNSDGDWHVQVLPSGLTTARLLNKRNLLKAGGTLVVEVIPADQASVPLPRLGALVRVTGALVVDSDNGWRELHPAWQIVPVGR